MSTYLFLSFYSSRAERKSPKLVDVAAAVASAPAAKVTNAASGDTVATSVTTPVRAAPSLTELSQSSLRMDDHSQGPTPFDELCSYDDNGNDDDALIGAANRYL